MFNDFSFLFGKFFTRRAIKNKNATTILEVSKNDLVVPNKSFVLRKRLASEVATKIDVIIFFIRSPGTIR